MGGTRVATVPVKPLKNEGACAKVITMSVAKRLLN